MPIFNQSDAYRQPIWYQLKPIKTIDVNWHPSHLIWTNLVPIEVENTQLAEIQDHKGTLFENFLRGLSTNEKPVFWALDQWEAPISVRFFCCPNLEFTNPMIISQLTDIWVQLENQCNATRNENWISMDCQWNANWLPIKSLLTSNQVSIDNQFEDN